MDNYPISTTITFSFFNPFTNIISVTLDKPESFWVVIGHWNNGNTNNPNDTWINPFLFKSNISLNDAFRVTSINHKLNTYSSGAKYSSSQSQTNLGRSTTTFMENINMDSLNNGWDTSQFLQTRMMQVNIAYGIGNDGTNVDSDLTVSPFNIT